MIGIISEPKNVMVFRTNITTKTEAKKLLSFINKKEIIKWSIDLEDHDRVLRIVSDNFSSKKIVDLAKTKGLECAELE
jgi:hypothetical protein